MWVPQALLARVTCHFARHWCWRSLSESLQTCPGLVYSGWCESKRDRLLSTSSLSIVYNLHWQLRFQFIPSQHANNAVSIWVSTNSSTRLRVWARALWVLSNGFLVTYVLLLSPKYTCVLPKPIATLSKWRGHLQLFLPVLLATDAAHGFLSHFKLDLYQYRVACVSLNYCLLPVWAPSALCTGYLNFNYSSKQRQWGCNVGLRLLFPILSPLCYSWILLKGTHYSQTVYPLFPNNLPIFLMKLDGNITDEEKMKKQLHIS